MNRRKFFKRLMVGATAIVVVPKIIEEVTKPDPYKNLYYPSMQDITYEQFLRYCNVKLPDGQLIVYGTGGNGLTETTFQEQWEQFIIEGKMGYSFIRLGQEEKVQLHGQCSMMKPDHSQVNNMLKYEKPWTGVVKSINNMSWSIQFIGKPEKVVEALNAQSEKLSDVSKAEYDLALPHLVGLVNLNHGLGNAVKLAASGHGNTGGEKPTSYLVASIETIYGLLV